MKRRLAVVLLICAFAMMSLAPVVGWAADSVPVAQAASEDFSYQAARDGIRSLDDDADDADGSDADTTIEDEEAPAGPAEDAAKANRDWLAYAVSASAVAVIALASLWYFRKRASMEE